MAYLLDTNVFTEARRRYYAFDLCPGFWDWLRGKNQQGHVYSVHNMRDEIEVGTDQLVTWVRSQGAKFFLQPDAEVMKALKAVGEWVMAQGYALAATNEFMQAADYWLIGHALAKGHTVVTHELPGTSGKRVKIPDVCVGLKVEFTQPFTMLRREGARFILG